MVLIDNELLYSSNNFKIYTHSTHHYTNRRMGSARHYINYIAKGQCRYVTSTETLELKQGDFFYIPMGLSYESYSWGEQGFELYSCGFSLFPEAQKRRFKPQKLPPEFIGDFLRIPLNRLPDSAALAGLYSLIRKLLPHLEEETEETPALLEKLAGLILRNPSARIPELAQQCDLAASTLYVQVKALCGKTPNEYRMDVLMAEAIRLLGSTDLPVQHVAEQLGFSSANYFRQMFKKHTSVTPSRIRSGHGWIHKQ